MIDSKRFFDILESCQMVDPIYRYLLELVDGELGDIQDKEPVLVLFAIHAALISDGNVGMSLDRVTLKAKWGGIVESTRILFEDKPEFDKEAFDGMKDASFEAIDGALNALSEKNLPQVIGEGKIYLIQDGWLYFRKHALARAGIIESVKRIFRRKENGSTPLDIDEICTQGFALSSSQRKAVTEGLNENLLVTGGPGTGKTTSILFLLVNLLCARKDRKVYLVAPSGKASARMKESIVGGLAYLDEGFKASHDDVISLVKEAKESTIHKLLDSDRDRGGYLYHEGHHFETDSVFVIDEASMIDVCLFDALLSAIPEGARVFILGDKNQLPSVECGAVFNDLLASPALKDHVIILDESIRFGSDTRIYALAKAVNEGTALPEAAWRQAKDFAIEEEAPEKPIFYYQTREGSNERKDIRTVYERFGQAFFKDLQTHATGLDPEDAPALERLHGEAERAKVLCAEKEGWRGSKDANAYFVRHFIDKSRKTSVDGYYAGELIMITRNNRVLGLNNGDTGVLVTFGEDDTLYLMVKKKPETVQSEGMKKDKVFVLGDFVFYPFRMVSREEMDFGYAMTIHKSQGSDYRNILVTLPRKVGHPLANRQIVYTAITRTKGNTYIVASQEILEAARDTLIKRDTNATVDSL